MTRTILALACLACTAAQAQMAEPCMPLAGELDTIARMGGVISLLSRAQFHFTRGLYVANPMTPMGMPPGDQAILVDLKREDKSVVVVFVTIAALVCGHLTLNERLRGLLEKAAFDGGDPS